jgi:hypothetical protein
MSKNSLNIKVTSYLYVIMLSCCNSEHCGQVVSTASYLGGAGFESFWRSAVSLTEDLFLFFISFFWHMLG